MTGTYPTNGQYSVGVAAGDLTLDGRPDFVLGNILTSHLVSLLYGDGTGGFMRTDMMKWGDLGPLLIQDLNADGKPDIVITDQGLGLVNVFLNDGTGLAYRLVSLPAGVNASGAAIGDLDRDGRPDIAVSADGGIRVFQNRL